MPRKGVVDNALKVYGVSNLRIADASIIPIPLAAHIQATVYAIGEKVRFLHYSRSQVSNANFWFVMI